MATRMSLSFPVLISTVPLRAVDWTEEEAWPAHRKLAREAAITAEREGAATLTQQQAELLSQYETELAEARKKAQQVILESRTIAEGCVIVIRNDYIQSDQSKLIYWHRRRIIAGCG